VPGAGPGRAAPAAPSDALARLTLDVLVYSDQPAERFVFINGRKYVEGQAVTGDAVIEQITPDGAVMRHADQRIVLRPKLNPYVRPGSP
jgi:general secretion pathway protein B